MNKKWLPPTIQILNEKSISSAGQGPFQTEILKYCYNDVVKTFDTPDTGAFQSTRTTSQVTMGNCS